MTARPLRASHASSSYAISASQPARNPSRDPVHGRRNHALFNPHLPVVELIWARSLGHLLFVIAIFAPGHGWWRLFVTRKPAVQVTRVVPFISPFHYVQLVWAARVGYLVFGEVAGLWTWAGAAIIIASGIYIILQETHAH